MVAGDRGVTSGGGMTMPDPGEDCGPGLAAFQSEVARLFFGLRESTGFLLAGGAKPPAPKLRLVPANAALIRRPA